MLVTTNSSVSCAGAPGEGKGFEIFCVQTRAPVALLFQLEVTEKSAVGQEGEVGVDAPGCYVAISQ